MKPIKVGVVGIGHMGKYHVKCYHDIPGVSLTAIADVNESNLSEMAKEYGATPYLDYSQVYDNVEAVSIAVPTRLHYPIAKDFLNAGIHVLLEKPITQDIKEAEELMSIAQKKNLVLQVGHVERFNAAIWELKKVLNNPLFVECRRLGPFNTRIDDAGVVMDLLIHDIDIVLNLIDSAVVELHAVGTRVYSSYEDIANVQIIFANGCIANLTASRATENKIRTLAITQPDAYIFLDYAEQDIHIHRQTTGNYILTHDTVGYQQRSVIERVFVHKDNPLKLELSHFLSCIANETKPLTTPEDDLTALRITLSVLEQIKARTQADSSAKTDSETSLIPLPSKEGTGVVFS
ncbi:Gfo/Idh/MocA family oxidoreductase [bacterium]|nr:Gfo/Idh/MocA family oxidoreductase [bacterium]MBU1753489.1 Gfo/Idh/MocA family oxidoreductase [bacterium]